MQPLQDVVVLDFSSLLPGPMASLLLAEAGARVIKIEKPGSGDEMRGYSPKAGDDSLNFAMLNRGKESLAIDLKADDCITLLQPLIEQADVLVEQFRPGVMARVGLDYEAVRRLNPRLIYCSITGWGQTGPKANQAGHDLNYMAQTGVLGLTGSAEGVPALPPVLAADVCGGAYPAVMNILLALLQRQRTGMGSHLDISMADNLFPLMYWGLGNGFGANQWPQMNGDTVTGGSPRYQIYPTQDGRYLAAAPLEDKFWEVFCELIELPLAMRSFDAPSAAVKDAVAQRIVSQSAAHWTQVFAGHDVCCSVVCSLKEAVEDEHFKGRGLFERPLRVTGATIAALPTPIASLFRLESAMASAPPLDEGRQRLLPELQKPAAPTPMSK